MESKCKHCNNIFYLSDKKSGWMANHSRWCEMNPKYQLYRDELKSRDTVKIMNDSRTKSGYKNQYSKARVLGLEIPKSKLIGVSTIGTPHSEETKNIISQKRKKYLRENPEKHPWKNSKKFISKPCEFLKDYLLKNSIEFFPEFTPLSDRFFSIDIAFPDSMVGIEINGNQHYNKNGTLKEYYQKRHDLIVLGGWKLHQIHYSKCYRPLELMKTIDIF